MVPSSPFLFVLADALANDLLDLRIMHLLEAGWLDALRTEQSYLARPRPGGTINTTQCLPWHSLLPRALLSLSPETQ